MFKFVNKTVCLILSMRLASRKKYYKMYHCLIFLPLRKISMLGWWAQINDKRPRACLLSRPRSQNCRLLLSCPSHFFLAHHTVKALRMWEHLIDPGVSVVSSNFRADDWDRFAQLTSYVSFLCLRCEYNPSSLCTLYILKLGPCKFNMQATTNR